MFRLNQSCLVISITARKRYSMIQQIVLDLTSVDLGGLLAKNSEYGIMYLYMYIKASIQSKAIAEGREDCLKGLESGRRCTNCSTPGFETDIQVTAGYASYILRVKIYWLYSLVYHIDKRLPILEPKLDAFIISIHK